MRENYDEREQQIGEETMREFEKVVTLRAVDSKWMDHIDAMDQLRQGIHLRAYGGTDPLREYQFEGFEMFQRDGRDDPGRSHELYHEGARREQPAAPGGRRRPDGDPSEQARDAAATDPARARRKSAATTRALAAAARSTNIATAHRTFDLQVEYFQI